MEHWGEIAKDEDLQQVGDKSDNNKADKVDTKVCMMLTSQY